MQYKTIYRSNRTTTFLLSHCRIIVFKKTTLNNPPLELGSSLYLSIKFSFRLVYKNPQDEHLFKCLAMNLFEVSIELPQQLERA